MRRRKFITLFCGAVVACPLGARAQQRGGIHRIGVLLPSTANDAEYPSLLNAFLQGLQQLGWSEGRNLQIDIRWSGGNADGINKNAAELAALAPDVIIASGSSTVGPLLQATRTIPIVFVVVPVPPLQQSCRVGDTKLRSIAQTLRRYLQVLARRLDGTRSQIKG